MAKKKKTKIKKKAKKLSDKQINALVDNITDNFDKYFTNQPTTNKTVVPSLIATSVSITPNGKKKVLDTGDVRITFLNNKKHSFEGQPAVDGIDGLKMWYNNGVLSRLDGPAVEFPNGKTEYYINGKFFQSWAEFEANKKLILTKPGLIKTVLNKIESFFASPIKRFTPSLEDTGHDKNGVRFGTYDMMSHEYQEPGLLDQLNKIKSQSIKEETK